MKIKLNSEDLRMTVLKQIVSNASLGMKIDRERGFIDWLIPITLKNLKLKRLRIRADKLQEFETSLSLNDSEFIEIDYHDVNFIYKGLR